MWQLEKSVFVEINKVSIKTTDGGYNLTDNRSHKIQYNDPVIGNFHICPIIQAVSHNIRSWRKYALI